MTKRQIVAKLDRFTRAFLAAALWSSTDGSTPFGGQPLEDNYGIEDFSLDSLRQFIAECRDFQEANEADLAQAGNDERNGQDFWLTRNRHGAGFWDRGCGAVGKRLTDAAHAYGSVDLYISRGLVHAQ